MKPDMPESLERKIKPEHGGGHGGLLERMKQILASVLEKLDEAEREKEIIRLLKSIEDKLARLGGSGSERESQIVALMETEFRPIIQGLKDIS